MAENIDEEMFTALWSTVSAESEELLTSIEQILLELEQQEANEDSIDELFRSLHTFKGTMGMMGLTTAESVAHQAEEVVILVRDHGVQLTSKIIDILLQSLDILNALKEQAVQFQKETNTEVATEIVKILGDLLNEIRVDEGNTEHQASTQDNSNHLPDHEDDYQISQDELDGIWETVKIEGEEKLIQLEEILLSLEDNFKDEKLIAHFFREIHTLKSTFGMMGLTEAERLAHLGEDIALLIRDYGVALTTDTLDLLLSMVDQLKKCHSYAVINKKDLIDENLNSLCSTLKQHYKKLNPEDHSKENSIEEKSEDEDVGFGIFTENLTNQGDNKQINADQDNHDEDNWGLFEPLPEKDSKKSENWGFFEDVETNKKNIEDENWGFFTENNASSDCVWQELAAEIGQNLDDIETTLLNIEEHGLKDIKHSDDISSLFRAIHTFKGSVDAMGLTTTQSFAHQVEDLIDLIRSGKKQLTKSVIDLLFHSLDLLRKSREYVIANKKDISNEIFRKITDEIKLESNLLDKLEQQQNNQIQDDTQLVSFAQDEESINIFIEMVTESFQEFNKIFSNDDTDLDEIAVKKLLELFENIQYAANQMQIQNIKDLIFEIIQYTNENQIKLDKSLLRNKMENILEATKGLLNLNQQSVENNIDNNCQGDNDRFGFDDAFETNDKYENISTDVELPENCSNIQKFLMESDTIFGLLCQALAVFEQPSQSKIEIENAKQSVLEILQNLYSISERFEIYSFSELVKNIENKLKKVSINELSEFKKEFEQEIFSELTRLESTIDNYDGDGSFIIPSVYRQWHAENVFNRLYNLEEFSLQLLQIKNASELSNCINKLIESCYSIYHASCFYHLKSAANIALALSDLYSRIEQCEINFEDKLIPLVINFKEILQNGVEKIQSGEQFDEQDLEELVKKIKAFLVPISFEDGHLTSQQVIKLFNLTQEFNDIFTPQNLIEIKKLTDLNYLFFILHADLNADPNVTDLVSKWLASDDVTVITNVTKYQIDDQVTFDFFIATNLAQEKIEQLIKNFDSNNQLLGLTFCELNYNQQSMQQLSKNEEGFFNLDKELDDKLKQLKQLIGSLVSNRSMLKYLTENVMVNEFSENMIIGLNKAIPHWRTDFSEIQQGLDFFSDSLNHMSQLTEEIGNNIDQVQGLVEDLNTQSAENLFKKYRKLIDQYTDHGKQIHLLFDGGSINLDSQIFLTLDQVIGELLLLSVKSSIEFSQQRLEKKKTELAILSISVRKSLDEIEVIVEDDGSGLNKKELQLRAKEKNIENHTEIANWPSWIINETFGDIEYNDGSKINISNVASKVKQCNGKLNFSENEKGGLSISVSIPLSSVVIDGMVVRCGVIRYVVSLNAIRRILQVPIEDILHASADNGSDTIIVDGELVPIVPLNNTRKNPRVIDDINSEAVQSDNNQNEVIDSDDSQRKIFIVVESNQKSTAFPVDELLGQQQIMTQPLNGQLLNMKGVSGVAILGAGDVGVVLKL